MLTVDNTIEQVVPEYYKLYPRIAAMFPNTSKVSYIVQMYNSWVIESGALPKNVNIDKCYHEYDRFIETILKQLGCEFQYTYVTRKTEKVRKFTILRGAQAEVKGNLTTDPLDLQVARKYSQLLSSAISRNLPFNLTLSDVKKLLLRKTCFYTKVEFDPNCEKKKRTVDRLDSKKGYVKGNVVACTAEANAMKEHFFERVDYNQTHINLLFIKYFNLMAEGKISPK